MNEEYLQEIQSQEITLDPVPSLASDTNMELSLPFGDDPSLSPEDLAGADGVLTDDQVIVFTLVSSGDLDGIYTRLDASEAELISLQDTLAESNLLLEKVNYYLCAILALLVFFFCFKRIRSGVKSFTGRGLDE